MELGFVEEFYDHYAERYTKRRTEGGLLFNEFIERPAFHDLLGNTSELKDKRVLDIGCGPGIYTKDLVANGAKITAIDISNKMLGMAKQYCLNRLSAEQFEGINFKHVSFENYIGEKGQTDLIVATFMLSYFTNLEAFFLKCKSLLNRKGRLISSILHPVRTASIADNDGYVVKDYFKSNYYESDFISKSTKIALNRWTLEEISNAAYKAGLLIERILEPSPISNLPKEYESKANFFRNNPSILMVMLLKL